jgi:hypothetical protein
LNSVSQDFYSHEIEKKPCNRSKKEEQIMYDDNRRHRRPYQNSLGGLGAGIFLICLALAIFFGGFTGVSFLPILFVGLAFAALLGSFSSYDHRASYGGLHGFVWLLGLALCFWIGFWPWILLPIGVSLILGALATPILGGMSRGVPQAYPPYQQPYQYRQPYQPSQPSQAYQGYQSAEPPPGTFQAGEQEDRYPQQPISTQ